MPTREDVLRKLANDMLPFTIMTVVNAMLAARFDAAAFEAKLATMRAEASLSWLQQTDERARALLEANFDALIDSFLEVFRNGGFKGRASL